MVGVRRKRMLSEDMNDYIQRLTQQFPSVSCVWLIGSRSNGCDKPTSDWDFLVFSDDSIFEQVKDCVTFHWPNVDLLLVEEDGEFSKPFGKAKSGSLSKREWQQLSEQRAEYTGCKWIADIEAEEEGLAGLGDFECLRLNAYRIFSTAMP